jgi:hypothetical protein
MVYSLRPASEVSPVRVSNRLEVVTGLVIWVWPTLFGRLNESLLVGSLSLLLRVIGVHFSTIFVEMSNRWAPFQEVPIVEGVLGSADNLLVVLTGGQTELEWKSTYTHSGVQRNCSPVPADCWAQVKFALDVLGQDDLLLREHVQNHRNTEQAHTTQSRLSSEVLSQDLGSYLLLWNRTSECRALRRVAETSF